MAALQAMLCKPTAVSHASAHCSAKPEVVPQCHLKVGPPFSLSCSSSTSFASLCEYGGKSGSRRASLWASRAAAQEAEDASNSVEGEFEVGKALESVLDNDESKNLLNRLSEKALQDEESKALLKDFATAAERVAKAKEELESIDRREKLLPEIVSRMMSRAVDEETKADCLVTERARAVLAAEEELKAAEIALVTARAGGSVDNLSSKWEFGNIDEDLERVESGKAAAVSVLSGTLASIPFLLSGNELGIGSFLSIGGVVVSCALFGVTYRYILRRDLGNVQLKLGAAAAFALVRGIGQVDAIQLHVGYPAQGAEEVLLAALNASEGLFSFGFSALALEYCLREGIIIPFPSKKC